MDRCELELIVLWNGVNDGMDGDLFRKVEFVPKVPKEIKLREPRMEGERERRTAQTQQQVQTVMSRQWETAQAIAARANISRDVVRTSLRRLLEDDVIEKEKGLLKVLTGTVPAVYRLRVA